ncbi:MAG TPA: hypothetical protein VN493_21915 [Thermoanaerobaculia bacterium]|nr:hypothetical protein [Thermoanaerobaculia bacterium]
MPSSERPTLEEMEQLVERMGPDFLELCRSRGVSEVEAVKMVEEALVTLSHRWNRISDRARWLRETLDEQARNRPDAQRKEPEDERA